MPALIRATLVAYDGEPPLGGQGVYLRGLLGALPAGDVAAVTLAGRGEGAILFPRLVRRAPLDFSIYLHRHPGLLMRDAPDVVHVMGGPGGVLMARRLPVPVVYTAHHTYRQAYWRGHFRRVLSVAEARAYRRAAMILPVSESTADAVRALGVRAARIEVIAPGVDVIRPPQSPERDPRRLLFVGRLEPEKGVLDAVAVMAELAHSHGATAGVIGRGSQEPAVREAIAGAGEGVSFLGAVDDATVWREYARAAVVLMPSRYEGLGMVALEAMGAGAVVVAYDVTGLRDTVGGGGGGVLVPPGRTEAMTEAAASFLDDDAGRAEAARRGMEAVRIRHSWAAAAAKVVEIYRTVGGAPAPPG